MSKQIEYVAEQITRAFFAIIGGFLLIALFLAFALPGIYRLDTESRGRAVLKEMLSPHVIKSRDLDVSSSGSRVVFHIKGMSLKEVEGAAARYSARRFKEPEYSASTIHFLTKECYGTEASNALPKFIGFENAHRFITIPSGTLIERLVLIYTPDTRDTCVSFQFFRY